MQRTATPPVDPRSGGLLRRLLRPVLLPFLLTLGACTDASPVSPSDVAVAPDRPMMLTSLYPDAGVLTSSRDTCAWYTVAPELSTAF